uniref:Glutamyl-tRNA(Gln) amidotransferase subunit B, mitochondrial n=1 Tax=Steinernema glaseri TaxID=37863 RepID=A0A1I7ZR07_9BILA
MSAALHRLQGIHGFQKHFVRRLCDRRQLSVADVEKSGFQPKIGLEIHAQLPSKSKLFSRAPVDENAPPNSAVSFFDCGSPGTLPVLNKQCVLLAIKAGLVLNCEVPSRCRFDRKHYFYADMPMGYQITQQDHPIAKNGYFDFYVYDFDKKNSWYEKRLEIERVQLEMDSGKTIHDVNRSLIDLNRAGVALAEIVTGPTLTSAAEAVCFVEQLRLLFIHNRICEGEMHRGNLRVDANVSLTHPDGMNGTRTEIKNINSFRFIQSAIQSEIVRHFKVISSGEEVIKETRGVAFDGSTVSMRDKEVEVDYRMMPEPNLPVLRIRSEWLEDAKKSLSLDIPHLRYIQKFQMNPSLAIHIAKDEKLRRFVDRCLAMEGLTADHLMLWLGELKKVCQNSGKSYPPESDLVADRFAKAICFEATGKITKLVCIDLLRAYVSENERQEVEKLVEAGALWRITSSDEMTKLLEAVFQANAATVAKARGKPESKHKNKLRNALIEKSNKRISVDDAANCVAALLVETVDK